jgi:NAD(P)-dependent dehydrogenase (short-subunit alcohol dehydrogenase family)
MSLEGRVALVTGSSRGIGRAIAIGLAEDGADVAVNYVRNEAAAAGVVAEIEKLGRRAAAYRADVGNMEELDAMVNDVLNDFGHVDILVNNAITFPPVTGVARMPFEIFERQLRASGLAPARLAQLLIPVMRRRPRADIVMISSVATRHFAPYRAAYVMGKAAMEALAYTLAREERSNGIRVNVLRPGLIVTDDLTDRMVAAFGASDMAELDAKSPFGHLGSPEDVAGVVRFLVSEHGSFLSGQCIDVDGGGGLETRMDAWADQGVRDVPAAFRQLRDMKGSASA